MSDNQHNGNWWIWKVFWILLGLTTFEVLLGMFKPEFLVNTIFLGTKLLNHVFIILTIVKAYYITWDFMHMRDETSILRRVVVWTAVFLILYLSFIFIQEAGYIFDEFDDPSNYIKRDF